MNVIINVVIGAVVAVIFYAVATALVVFNHSTLIFGLIALVIFLWIGFGGAAAPITSRWNRPPPA